MTTYWIIVGDDIEADRARLEGFGVTVGTFERDENAFTGCTVPESALNDLDLYWGNDYWGIENV